MTAVAGYTEVVAVKSSNSAYSAGDKVNGIMEFSLTRNNDLPETTDFLDGGGYKTRIQALKDSSIDMSGQFESADAPQVLIRSSYASGATIWVSVVTDPAGGASAKGFNVPCLVESYDCKGSVGGVSEFSAKFVGNGTPLAI